MCDHVKLEGSGMPAYIVYTIMICQMLIMNAMRGAQSPYCMGREYKALTRPFCGSSCIPDDARTASQYRW